ncbi:MAG: hypothetical protein K8S27_06805 [Candidatus Omnitrophica bacterium]|nr:hypothetical protein [Candidatus Omnitrophota bacterium]
MKKIILITLILLYTIGCTLQNVSSKIIPSPSKKYQLKTTINNDKSDKTKYLCIKLYLLDQRGTELSQLQTGASHTMKWAVG